MIVRVEAGAWRLASRLLRSVSEDSAESSSPLKSCADGTYSKKNDAEEHCQDHLRLVASHEEAYPECFF